MTDARKTIYDEDDMPPGPQRLRSAVEKQAMRDGERREEWRWRFAGMAMQGLLAADIDDKKDEMRLAEESVACADALIRELELGER